MELINNGILSFEGIVDFSGREVPIESHVHMFIRMLCDFNPAHDVFIAGGYLRDRFIGRPWKDLDMFFIPARAQAQIYLPPSVHIGYTMEGEVLTQCRPNIGKIIGGNYSFFDHTFPFQIIQYKSSRDCTSAPMTIYDVADDMDYNINQFAYEARQNILFITKEALAGHLQRRIELLREDNGRSQELLGERLIKMKARFPDYHIEENSQIYPPLIDTLNQVSRVEIGDVFSVSPYRDYTYREQPTARGY